MAGIHIRGKTNFEKKKLYVVEAERKKKKYMAYLSNGEPTHGCLESRMVYLVRMGMT